MSVDSPPAPSRYVVGIDLGTTNSALAYVDTADPAWRVQTFSVPQLVAPGQVESRETLPSFHYESAERELPAKSLRLPWSQDDPREAVGVFARDQGTLAPGRLIASAKSWLCHPGVDRTAPLLPWHGAADVTRLSPVEASARYLRHLRVAWDNRFPGFPLAAQDVVVTLPASFDEVARELTIRAAQLAGLPRIVLIEEPQAAFYGWIHKHAADWSQRVSAGQQILVCDIGGGTTDFTLIRVRSPLAPREEHSTAPEPSAAAKDAPTEPSVRETAPRLAERDGYGKSGYAVQFHRVSVGEHLILGGDNMDLALAHHLERRLTGDGKLDPRQWAILLRTCRQVKETLLAEDAGPARESMLVNIPAAGAKLIGGGLQIEVTRDEVRRLLLEGFFPHVALEDKPVARRSGFQEFGLPYAPDAAITRYLAAFLTAHRDQADEPGTDAKRDELSAARPDIVLFNGGVLASPAIRERLLDVLQTWFRADDPNWTPLLLDNERLDLAVAYGAAYYGMVRRSQGVRIAAGLPRAYYIGVEASEGAPPNASVDAGTPSVPTSMAICLAPAGLEPGEDVDLTLRSFTLRTGQPVEFPLYVSSTKLTDKPGDLVAVDPERMSALPPLRTVLTTSRKGETGTLDVQLHARLTEIGTLDLWCGERGGRRSWKLQFDVRSTTQTDVEAHAALAERQGFFDEDSWQACRQILIETFGPTETAEKSASHSPDRLMKRLAEALGQPRHEWPASLLRRMWETLIEVELGRRRSRAHEARWLNVVGFALRPGFGLAADDWRVGETRRVLQNKLAFPSAAGMTELWILWRRIAGGLAAGQQQALADPLLASIRQTQRQLTSGQGKSGDFSQNVHEAQETWRLLGSLELLAPRTRLDLGRIVLDLLPRKKAEPLRPALIWTLGRLGARVPAYGPLNAVLPTDAVCGWLEKLLALDLPDSALTVMQLARRTGDRYRDIPDELRQRVLDWLASHAAPPHFSDLVREAGRLAKEEETQVFGESLPKGLSLKG